MRKLVESTFVSLDGKVSGDMDFWMAMGPYQDEKHQAYATSLMETAEALVLGRETYEGFAPSWSERSGDWYTDRINAMPKYVASRTLDEATWNAEILQGDAVEAVAGLKEQGDGGTLLKFGTGPFSQELIEAGLLDELHLWVFPFVAGGGDALLPGLAVTHFDLTGATELGNGIVVLRYSPKIGQA